MEVHRGSSPPEEGIKMQEMAVVQPPSQEQEHICREEGNF